MVDSDRLLRASEVTIHARVAPVKRQPCLYWLLLAAPELLWSTLAGGRRPLVNKLLHHYSVWSSRPGIIEFR